MANLDTCLGILRRLIAKGDVSGMPWAERAINEYWDATLEKGRKSGLRLIQLEVSEQRTAVTGAQHDFAQTANAFTEKKLRGE